MKLKLRTQFPALFFLPKPGPISRLGLVLLMKSCLQKKLRVPQLDEKRHLFEFKVLFVFGGKPKDTAAIRGER